LRGKLNHLLHRGHDGSMRQLGADVEHGRVPR
jgi:hypothetical protein